MNFVGTLTQDLATAYQNAPLPLDFEESDVFFDQNAYDESDGESTNSAEALESAFKEGLSDSIKAYGSSCESWLLFLSDFPSGVKYSNRVNHFLAYALEKNIHPDDLKNLESCVIR